MKTVGIIGGLGPETTAKFYLEIVFGCYKKNKENRPPILIWNVPLKYKIEEDVLKNAIGEEKNIPYLIEAAKRLERAGTDFLVMPCNTLHIFIDEIRKSVKIPILSIVEETVKFLKDKNISKVGLLATTTTIKRKLYETALERENIKQILPNKNDQDKLGEIVSNIVLNKYSNKDKKEIAEIIEKNFENKGVDCVILACTDLQNLIKKYPNITIYDTMDIFADATVNNILG